MIAFVLTLLFGCDSKVASQSLEQTKIDTSQKSITPKQDSSTTTEPVKKQDPQSEPIGKSDSCEIQPEILNWHGKSYQIKNVNTSSEPGMKFGFVKCDKGNFTLGDDGPSSLTVYSNRDPRTNNDLIFIGKWGRALYSASISNDN